MEIIIIGGGAAGLAAAIRASEKPGVHVTLLERQSRVGRKLLSTGNGRCNLSNTGAAPERYHGADPAFVRPVLDRWTPERVLTWFGELGLKTVTERGGRVYPMSDHAASVLDVLRLALEKPNVTVLTDAAVERIRPGFTVEWAEGSLRGDRVIVACGGCAGGKLGGVSDGYRLLEALGHSRTALHPALTPLRTGTEFPRALKGIRAEARVRLLRKEKPVASETGDLQFTDTGVSGVAVFAVSRWAKEGDAVSADFFPDTGGEELKAQLRLRRERWPELEANQILTGTVQSRLGLMLCKYAGIGGGGLVRELGDADLDRLAGAMKDFRLPVTGLGGFDGAQVTAGGVRTGEFSPETMESRLVPGLYACGEVLDIDGDCGGFNLHWAWGSGLTAGEASCC